MVAITKATRRYRNTKGAIHLTHGDDAYNKRGLNKARRALDHALIREQQEEAKEPAFPTNAKGVTFRLVVTTQVHENYGAHAWDGKGQCPQYWKAKGGNEYQREIGDANAVLALGRNGLENLAYEIGGTVGRNDEYWWEYPIGWVLVPSNEETYEEQNLREMHEEGYLNAEQYKQALYRLHA